MARDIGHRLRQDLGDVACIRAKIEDVREVAIDIEQTLAETGCYLIAKVVYSPAGFDVGSCALFLEVFCLAGEDLERGGARGLDGVCTADICWA